MLVEGDKCSQKLLILKVNLHGKATFPRHAACYKVKVEVVNISPLPLSPTGSRGILFKANI